MSIELELALFAVLCFVCAIGILFWGFGTGNEFEYKAEQMKKWAKEELERREAERKEGEADGRD